MALTREAVATYVRSIQGVRALTKRNIEALWRELPADPEEAVDALLRVLPGFLGQHADLAGVAAIDFYDEVRDDASFTPELLDAPIPDVERDTRWAVTPIFSTTPDNAAALGRLTGVADRLTINRSHETIFENGSRDPADPRYARVPVGTTCAWCRMLASRGAVYRSRATAMRTSHADCDCRTVPVFEGDELPYDQQRYRSEYDAARRQADSGSPSQILSAWREMDGIH